MGRFTLLLYNTIIWKVIQNYPGTNCTTRLGDTGHSVKVCCWYKVSAWRSDPERCPSSREDHSYRCAAQWGGVKKDSLRLLYSWNKLLAFSQIAYNGKGVLETPYNLNFLCPFINESWKLHAIHVLIAWLCFKLIYVDA